MTNLHVYSPPITNTSIRLLPKYGRKFISKKFTTLQEAIRYGMEYYLQGFRIFRQNCYEWHDPSNILLADFKDIRKEIKK